MTDENITKFTEAFKKVKALGKIKTNRSGNTGIGKTLEDIMNVEENNIEAPDLYGFEIKSQRTLSDSYVTLFAKSPNPKGINNNLRLNYGSNDEVFANIKVLHTSIFLDQWNTHKSGFGFTLSIDRKNEKLILKVKNLETDVIVEENVYWDFSSLEDKLKMKMQNLAFIKAKSEIIDSEEFFTFSSCTLFSGGLTLERFFEALQKKHIMFDIRIGAYKNPKSKSYGKSHDHGSAFRIKKENFLSLYNDETNL